MKVTQIKRRAIGAVKIALGIIFNSKVNHLAHGTPVGKRVTGSIDHPGTSSLVSGRFAGTLRKVLSIVNKNRSLQQSLNRQSKIHAAKITASNTGFTTLWTPGVTRSQKSQANKNIAAYYRNKTAVSKFLTKTVTSNKQLQAIVNSIASTRLTEARNRNRKRLGIASTPRAEISKVRAPLVAKAKSLGISNSGSIKTLIHAIQTRTVKLNTLAKLNKTLKGKFNNLTQARAALARLNK